jgi:hypothetical protein
LLGLLTILVKVGKIFKTNFSDVFGGWSKLDRESLWSRCGGSFNVVDEVIREEVPVIRLSINTVHSNKVGTILTISQEF